MRRSICLTSAILFGVIASVAQGRYGTDAHFIASIPTARFGQNFDTGLGAELSFYWETEDYLRIAAVFGYQHWPINKEAVSRYYTEMGGAGTLNPEGGTGAFPILLSLKLISPKPGVKPYGMVEGGFYIYTFKVSGTYTYGGTEQPIPDKTTSRTEPAFNLGFGILFPIDADISADLHLRYHIVKNSTYYQYDSNSGASDVTVSTSNFLSIALGISYSFAIN